jgi:hypothetical protein
MGHLAGEAHDTTIMLVSSPIVAGVTHEHDMFRPGHDAKGPGPFSKALTGDSTDRVGFPRCLDANQLIAGLLHLRLSLSNGDDARQK